MFCWERNSDYPQPAEGPTDDHRQGCWHSRRPSCERSMEGLSELKQMVAHRQGQLDVLSRWLGISQQPQPQPESQEASFTWESQHLGHPVRDRDGQRASVGAQRQPSPTAHSGGNGQRASVGAQRQPSPTAHSGGNGQASNRRLSCSGLESNRPRRTSMSIQPGVTPSWIIMQCLCMIMCMCTLLMVNVLGGL